MKEFPYKCCFAELLIKPLVSQEKDKCLALASLVEVSNFIPNIDTSVNLDILPVAFNACVINRVNKNKDVVDTQTAIAMYKHFINKPINVEHNRQKVIGTILTAGFSEFGSDKPLTEDQVRNMTGPFNVTLGGIIWRVVCPDLADHIEDSSDPTSPNHLSVSASWELGFTDYKVALLAGGAKNLAEATRIISDPAEVDKIRDSLTSLGGDGKIDDLFAYRMPSYDVLPLGIGFTEKPAAEVKGVATPSQEEIGITIPEAFDKGAKKNPQRKEVVVPNLGENKEIGILTQPAFDDKSKQLNRKEILGEQENQNKISQTANSNVKIERKVTMKITSLKDITDESLKECTASAVSDFIATELKKGSDEWETQKNALNNQLAKAQEDGQKLQGEQVKLQEQLKQVQATVDALSAEKTEREKVEKFNGRMSEVNEAYDLDDEVRAALVEDIRAIASDEDFEKWKAKAKVLLKGYAKKAPPFGKDKDKGDDKDKGKKCAADDMDDDTTAKKAKAAAEAAAAVAAAVENGDKSKGGLPNGSSADSPSLKEKYQSAFARENFVITI